MRGIFIYTCGCAKNDLEKELLLLKAKDRLKELDPRLFYFDDKDKKEDKLFGKIDFSNDRLVPIGDEVIFGKMYDMICQPFFIQLLKKTKL